MSDRCYLQIWVRPEYRAHFEETLGVAQEYEQPTVNEKTGAVLLVDQDAGGGGFDAREELAAAGYEFHGWHGNGYEYGPIAFAALDGHQWEVTADLDGFPVGRLRPDGTGGIAPAKVDLAAAGDYFSAMRELEERWSKLEQAGGEPFEARPVKTAPPKPWRLIEPEELNEPRRARCPGCGMPTVPEREGLTPEQAECSQCADGVKP